MKLLGKDLREVGRVFQHVQMPLDGKMPGVLKEKKGSQCGCKQGEENQRWVQRRVGVGGSGRAKSL